MIQITPVKDVQNIGDVDTDGRLASLLEGFAGPTEPHLVHWAEMPILPTVELSESQITSPTHAPVFDRIDANGDENIDPNEFHKAFVAGKLSAPSTPAPKSAGKTSAFDRIDANGDEIIDPNEFH